jgi:hypothetical protein
MQFASDIDGHVTKIRFYKVAGSTGAHTGNLWDAGGALLASVNFTGETASGWQIAVVSPPVAITAGATYVVSYSESAGFGYDFNYFDTGKDTGPLHVPAQGGVYGHGLGTFPTDAYNGSNYWVDVGFESP